MIRCNFCSDLAALECSGNSFCLYHRSLHDSTHSGDHKFEDVYCKLSDEGHFEFQDEITRRLKTLKDCRNTFASATAVKKSFTENAKLLQRLTVLVSSLESYTAEYIKDIQAILSQKISELDKLSLFYINLMQKEEFDKGDSLEIDKILSTRLTLNYLEPFSDNKFKDYIQQEIIKSKKIEITSSEGSNYLKSLSNEARFLADIIRCFSPKNIPEKMLRGIMLGIHEETGWTKAKRELLKLKIVAIDENLKLWSVDDSRLNDLNYMEILDSVKSECLKYCASNFLINDDTTSNTKTKREMKEMLDHVEKISENNKKHNEYYINILVNLAQAYVSLEYNEAKAEKYVKELIQMMVFITTSQVNISIILDTVSTVYHNLRKFEEAERFYLSCLSIYKKALPENHPDLATIYMKLGVLYHNKTEYTKSETFFLECFKIQEKILPKNHIDRVFLYMNLGLLYFSKTAYDEAEKFYLECLNIHEKILPINFSYRSNIYMNLGILYDRKKTYDKAELFFLESLKIQEQHLSECHPYRAGLYLSLGSMYYAKAEYDKAEQFLLKSLQIQEQILSKHHPDRLNVYNALGNLYESKAVFNTAENYFLKSLEIIEQILPEYHPNRAAVYMNLGVVYIRTVAYDKAEKFFLNSLKIFDQLLPVYHSDRLVIYNNLGCLYYSKAAYKKSQKFYLQYLNIREKFPSNNNDDINFIHSRLQLISIKLASQ